jgi:hypothetical protein
MSLRFISSPLPSTTCSNRSATSLYDSRRWRSSHRHLPSTLACRGRPTFLSPTRSSPRCPPLRRGARRSHSSQPATRTLCLRRRLHLQQLGGCSESLATVAFRQRRQSSSTPCHPPIVRRPTICHTPNAKSTLLSCFHFTKSLFPTPRLPFQSSKNR